jgi:transposase-like protein
MPAGSVNSRDNLSESALSGYVPGRILRIKRVAMDCPHCHSSSTKEREGRTVHSFRRFRCRECGRRFNERTGTALNRVQIPTDIVFLVVL